ncbi:ABC transporter substrate-binding protein [Neobacillus vireti]|uniref:ABC transporter substrate-binding protein n=1 Tax=Neobacillus vireti TaxID=220686 RepID=UPI002FFF4991
MKKLINVCVMLTIVLLLISGCSSSHSEQTGAKNGETKNEGVTITLLHRWPNEPFKGYFDEAIKEFKKTHPNVNINVISAINDDYKQKINVQLAGNTPPDIFFTWVGEYGNKFVREGKALDITKYVEDDKAWSDQIIPSTLKPFTVDNKVYGVPVLMDVRMMAYNKEIFKKLGLQEPKTWDEFITVLKAIKKSGITPLGLGNKEPWNGGLYITTLNQRIVDPAVLAKDYNRASGEFTDPGYVEALNKLKQLVPYMNEHPNALSREEERSLFVNGQIAIMPLHTIEFPYVKDAKFEWGTFNFPKIAGGKGDPSVITGAPEGFMVSKESKHPDVAVEFLKFITSKEMATKWVETTSVISTTKGAVNTDNSTPLMNKVIQDVEKANDMAIWIDTALDGKIFNPYLAGIQEMLNKKKTPEELMSEIQKTAKETRESAN